jgi:hypothetical protein
MRHTFCQIVKICYEVALEGNTVLQIGAIVNYTVPLLGNY